MLHGIGAIFQIFLTWMHADLVLQRNSSHTRLADCWILHLDIQRHRNHQWNFGGQDGGHYWFFQCLGILQFLTSWQCTVCEIGIVSQGGSQLLGSPIFYLAVVIRFLLIEKYFSIVHQPLQLLHVDLKLSHLKTLIEIKPQL